MKKAAEFIKNIRGSVGIFFHKDCDGACSAALLLSFLKKKGIRPVLFSGGLDEELFEEFSRKKANTVIFLDLPLGQLKEHMKLFIGKNVLIIDHHRIGYDFNKMGFVFVNPRLKKPDLYVSNTEYTYEILRKLGFRGHKWIVKLGASGDYTIKRTKKFDEACKIVDSIAAMKKERGMVSLARFLSRSKKLDDLLYKTDYTRLRDAYEKELEEQMALFERQMKKGVNFFEVDSKYSMTGTLSNRIFHRHPDITIITYSRSGDSYKVSGRSSKYDIGMVLQKAAKNIGRGGGHKQAGGANVKDIGLFIARMKKLLD